MWKINVINLIKTKASLSKEFKISPLDIDAMTMWEYELWIDALNNQIKDENEAQQSEMDKYDVDKYKKMAENPGRMMPNMSNMKMDFGKMKF